MTSEEFWHGDPRLVKAYQKANDLKREAENQKLWLQGLYIYDAFAVVLSNAFGKKGSKKQEYFKEPINILGKTEEDEEREAEEARQKLIAQLNGWKARWDKTHGKKE
jgi:hypothetical protein